MKYYFQLIRPINLLLTAFAMYAVRFFIIIPILKNCTTNEGYLAPYLNECWFVLLVLSVLLINAAGYVINDFCDIDTDAINKPEKLIISKKISFKAASIFYYVLNIAGIFLGMMLAYYVHALRLSSIHLAAVGLLWLYATQLKKMPIVGNLSVALLGAVVILMPVFFEPIVFYNDTIQFQTSTQLIFKISLIFSAFAFLMQLIRELIKDLQDVEGDEQTGCNTLPIWASIKTTKIICASIIIVSMIVLSWFQIHFFYHRNFYKLFNSWNLFNIILIQLPLLFVVIKIWKANAAKQYAVLSIVLKLVMLAGICSMLFIKLWFENYFN
ncbi:MAG: hypothetical protein RJA07_2352 [Bacteroidota bacterium]